MRMATDFGKPVTVLAGLGAILIFDRSGGRATAAAAALALLPTNALVEGLKRATYRARPDGSRKRSNAAFPSSHAANAFALAAVLARRWKRQRGVLGSRVDRRVFAHLLEPPLDERRDRGRRGRDRVRVARAPLPRGAGAQARRARSCARADRGRAGKGAALA